MATESPWPIVRISVRIQMGENLLAASDDPLFLGLRGPAGREFRLAMAHGKSLRRGQVDHFVLGAPDDPATNVAQPALNDPQQPPLSADQVSSVYLRKGMEPIPNVRALGEMDDRLQISEVAVAIEAEGGAQALRFARKGPLWLGLVCGLELEIPRVNEAE